MSDKELVPGFNRRKEEMKIKQQSIESDVADVKEEHGRLFDSIWGQYFDEFPDDPETPKDDGLVTVTLHKEDWGYILSALETASCGYQQTDAINHCCDYNELVIKFRRMLNVPKQPDEEEDNADE